MDTFPFPITHPQEEADFTPAKGPRQMGNQPPKGHATGKLYDHFKRRTHYCSHQGCLSMEHNSEIKKGQEGMNICGAGKTSILQPENLGSPLREG